MKMIEVKVNGREFTYRRRGKLVTIVGQGKVDPLCPEVQRALASGYLAEIPAKPRKKEGK